MKNTDKINWLLTTKSEIEKHGQVTQTFTLTLQYRYLWIFCPLQYTVILLHPHPPLIIIIIKFMTRT